MTLPVLALLGAVVVLAVVYAIAGVGYVLLAAKILRRKQ
jgi:hypothetical protein